jgi:PPK2 family polyphosphate:nucleotide phosphotransferase
MSLQKLCKHLPEAFLVKPGKRAHLSKRNPSDTCGLKDKDVAGADKLQDHNVDRLCSLQQRLYADARFGILIILQGIDASGKDGTTRHLFTGVNPQGVRVHSFKVPTPEEASHDYLWRIHADCPQRGEIVVFNRSHYEDILVPRVHDLVPKKTWQARYRQINQFERHLVENDTVIIKLFLHISKEEQRVRLQERISDPAKNWKMNLKDLDERKHWADYTAAYEDILTECSTDEAPWHVIPADHKWFRNLVVSQIVADRLDALDLKYPKPTFDPKKVRVV